MPKRTRRKSRDVSTRERILDEAERLIGLHGYDSLRLRDIAEPIGIQVPSIYGHFDGRDAVLAAVAQRYIEGLREQFPYDGESDPTKALVDGVRQMVRHLASHPAYTRLKLRDLESPGGMPDINWAAGGDPVENQRSGPLAAMFQRVERLLTRGHERGEFRKVEFVQFWTVLMGSALMRLTWPSQDVLQGRASSAALERIVRDIEDLSLRFVRPD
jgi:AcrR family transcriptional regulator